MMREGLAAIPAETVLEYVLAFCVLAAFVYWKVARE